MGTVASEACDELTPEMSAQMPLEDTVSLEHL
jgi:hypothetical protein